MLPLLCLVFFFSGASSLVFETLWFHGAGLALGNSVWASSLVLSAFMAGLAVGNGIATRFGDRVRNPVRLYGQMEIGVGITGVALVLGLPSLGPALAPVLGSLAEHGFGLNGVRFLIAFALLVVPSTAMGLTLPLLTRAVAGGAAGFGAALGRLYGWNTLGAVVGAVAGDMLLVAALGIRATAFVAGTLNVAVGVAALALARRAGAEMAPAPSDLGPGTQGASAAPAPGPRPWLAAAFAAGFSLLAFEVVWFRVLSYFVATHSSSFAVMLGVVLSGIAIGGLLASRWLRRAPDAHRFTGSAFFVAGAVSIGAYALFLRLLPPLGRTVEVAPLIIAAVAAPLLLPTSLVSGALFALSGAGLRHARASATQTTGAITLANTVGAALGALLGGFLLLARLGAENTIFLLAALYGVMGAFFLRGSRAPGRVRHGLAAAFVLAAVLFPFGAMEERIFIRPLARYIDRAEDLLLGVREGVAETILYVGHRFSGQVRCLRMITNGFSMSSACHDARRYMKLYAYLPLALNPRLRNVLLINYGVGMTAKALADTPWLGHIDVVDISRDVVDMNRLVFPRAEDLPLHDPRTHLHIEDGRYFLQTASRRYDLITGEPPPPRNAGVVNLYTREYFALMRGRLAEGGMVTYWLPMHELSDAAGLSIVRAFCDVFADCSLWHGQGTNLMLLGSKGARPAPAPTQEQFLTQLRHPSIGATMRSLGYEAPGQLGALFIADAQQLAVMTSGVPPLVDDQPKRIQAPATHGATALEKAWTDGRAARQRFQQSPWVAQALPEAERAAALPQFEVQHLINAIEYAPYYDRLSSLSVVHQVLTETAAIAPAIWLLGSDADLQRIVAEASPQLLARPEISYQRGVGLLASRAYQEAADAFARAATRPDLEAPSLMLRAYCLSLLGRVDEARDLAAANRDKLTPSSLGRFAKDWSWLEGRFDLARPASR